MKAFDVVEAYINSIFRFVKADAVVIARLVHRPCLVFDTDEACRAGPSLER